MNVHHRKSLTVLQNLYNIFFAAAPACEIFCIRKMAEKLRSRGAARPEPESRMARMEVFPCVTPELLDGCRRHGQLSKCVLYFFFLADYSLIRSAFRRKNKE